MVIEQSERYISVQNVSTALLEPNVLVLNMVAVCALAYLSANIDKLPVSDCNHLKERICGHNDWWKPRQFLVN